jgi:hypothetical protein
MSKNLIKVGHILLFPDPPGAGKVLIVPARMLRRRLPRNVPTTRLRTIRRSFCQPDSVRRDGLVYESVSVEAAFEVKNLLEAGPCEGLGYVGAAVAVVADDNGLGAGV